MSYADVYVLLFMAFFATAWAAFWIGMVTGEQRQIAERVKQWQERGNKEGL
jgi:hypothetical protein